MTKRPVQSSMPEAAPDHEEAQDVTFYTALLGSLPGMAYRMLNKPDWPAEFISEGSLALTGYASADLTIGGKHTYNELIHPDDREYVWQGVQAAVALHQPYRLTYRIHTADGTMKWVNEQGSGVYAGDGSLLFLTGFITDITERQEAEEAKRTSQQMLQNVLAHFPGVVFWKDQNSVYLGCNQAFATGAGLATPADIVGKTDYDLPWAHTEADAYRADDQQVMAGGVPKLHIIETQYQADGNVVWFDTSKIPLLDEDGHVIGVLGTSTDITTLKQSEAEQERYAERLSVASEIAGKAQTILDPDTLLQAVIPLIKERFGLYYVHVYTVDEAAGELKLRAGYGEPGRIMVEQGHSIPLNHEQSLVATAARTKEVVLVNDVTKNPNFLPNPLLPDTKSEVAVPAIAGGKVLGVFDVQHDMPGYFTQADLDVFQ
ncbi:MAG: PAS domain S-box protein, partial [Chloroflexi bacterium]|nr:PAS domain S-box protein [Chloroflexota bacterium]